MRSETTGSPAGTGRRKPEAHSGAIHQFLTDAFEAWP